jgi:antitoxin component YwqK of YwqJK toxin-antitoxin module
MNKAMNNFLQLTQENRLYSTSYVIVLLLFCFNNAKANYFSKNLINSNHKCQCQVAKERKELKANDPKKLTVEYYSVDTKGDTILLKNYEKNEKLRTKYQGHKIFRLVSKNGLPFSGITLKGNYNNSDLISMPGCYKTISNIRNGEIILTEIYYPNGKLKSKSKGKYSGIFSDLYLLYDYNGVLLKRVVQQPGIFFSMEILQEKGKFNGTSQIGLITQLIDSAYTFNRTIVIERTFALSGIDFSEINKPKVKNGQDEKLVIQNTANLNGETFNSRFICKFFDYQSIGQRKFNYNHLEHDPDTVFRLHVEYLEAGGIKTLGQYFMNARHGIWNYYHDDGTLKDVELYSEGRKQYSLHDDNALIYFHVLYDKANGEVLQYKNDWIPHFTKDSLFLYDFNQHSWHQHERKKFDILEFWEINYDIDRHKKFFRTYFRSRFKKENYDDGRAKSIGFVTDREERTGIWIDFSHDGDTVVICDYYYGKPNGIYRKYIKEVLVEKRDEIPEWRKDDPVFLLSIPYEFPIGLIFKRRNYWFRH